MPDSPDRPDRPFTRIVVTSQEALAEGHEWVPTKGDLAPWAQALIDDAYLNRDRGRCSREDFTAGAIGMLAALRWRSAFSPCTDDFPFPERATVLPSLVEAFVRAGPRGRPGLAEITEDRAAQDTELRGGTPDATR